MKINDKIKQLQEASYEDYLKYYNRMYNYKYDNASGSNARNVSGIERAENRKKLKDLLKNSDVRDICHDIMAICKRLAAKAPATNGAGPTSPVFSVDIQPRSIRIGGDIIIPIGRNNGSIGIDVESNFQQLISTLNDYAYSGEYTVMANGSSSGTIVSIPAICLTDLENLATKFNELYEILIDLDEEAQRYIPANSINRRMSVDVHNGEIVYLREDDELIFGDLLDNIANIVTLSEVDKRREARLATNQAANALNDAGRATGIAKTNLLNTASQLKAIANKNINDSNREKDQLSGEPIKEESKPKIDPEEVVSSTLDNDEIEAKDVEDNITEENITPFAVTTNAVVNKANEFKYPDSYTDFDGELRDKERTQREKYKNQFLVTVEKYRTMLFSGDDGELLEVLVTGEGEYENKELLNKIEENKEAVFAVKKIKENLLKISRNVAGNKEYIDLKIQKSRFKQVFNTLRDDQENIYKK